MRNLFIYFIKQLTFSEPAIYNILLGFIIALIISRLIKFDVSLNVSENLILSILAVGVSFVLLYNTSSLPFLIKFGKLRLEVYLALLYLSGEIATLFYTLLLVIVYSFLSSISLLTFIPYFLVTALSVFLFLVSLSTLLSLIITGGRLDCYIIIAIYPMIVVPTFIFSFFESEINPLWAFGVASGKHLLNTAILLVLSVIFIYLLIVLIKRSIFLSNDNYYYTNLG
ncbi:hypothetical protein [Stygiolobus caldivivus]|uniref:Uncharacterized protein n=1 Tax=Stygiolobus caldivivus TaxID=2824673 RepID=A0A8D5U412_9CREN|nr:hypothetical protein [Stygiolobus caldivivus]BCU68868.1 hypothetical protein KN1_01650 [Stygiolobus caldivivus]